MGRRQWRAHTWKAVGVAMTAFALLVGAALPASAAELMRVTFVRHGQSAGNASGLIDTSTPGPVLTPTGQQQAENVVGALGANNYDAVYASTMVRTQLTATPTSQFLRLPIQVLPGLQEIEAGVFEGTPESAASSGYGLFPLAWAVQGNRNLRIPGSIDGNEFDARMDGALRTMYDSGDRNPVVFSHGGAIMFWTMMNAQNLTAAQKIDLLRTAPLSNTNYVVVEGNPEDGWTLVNWNGRLFSPEPTLQTEVQRQTRTLMRQLATTVNQIVASFASLNPARILAAITGGFADAAYSLAKFTVAVGTKLGQELNGPSAQAAESVAALPTAPGTVATTRAVATPSVTRAAAATTGDQAPVVEPTKGSVTVTGKSTPVDESSASAKPTPPATPSRETVEAAKSQPEPAGTPNGATDLTDGNKAAPGVSSATQTSGTAGRDAAVEAVAEARATTTAASTPADAAPAAGSGAGEHAQQDAAA